MSRELRPSGLELALNTLWLPDTAHPRPQGAEPVPPQRPNREQRRRIQRATKRKGRGWTR